MLMKTPLLAYPVRSRSPVTVFFSSPSGSGVNLKKIGAMNAGHASCRVRPHFHGVDQETQFHAFAFRGIDLRANRGHLVARTTIKDCHPFRPVAQRGPCRVNGSVATADDRATWSLSVSAAAAAT